VKRFDESLQKTASLPKSQHALHTAVQLRWMSGMICWMNILGVFNVDSRSWH